MALGPGLKRLIVAAIVSLTILLVLHQLSYTRDVLSEGELRESVDLIKRCEPSSLESLDEDRIPNIIHQVWKNSNVSTYSTEIEASYDSWKKYFEPLNYTVKLWTDDDVLRLVKSKYSWLLSTYQGYRHNIQRADIARLVIVHAEGGIYADLDVSPTSVSKIECLQRLGMQAIFAPTGGNAGVSNHFFMAKRESRFLQSALEEAKRRGGATSKRILLPYLRVFWSTGPIMVTAAVYKYVWLFGGTKHDLGLLDEQYTWDVVAHAAGRSWHGTDGQALNYMGDHVRMLVTLMGVMLVLMTVAFLCFVRMRHGKSIGIFTLNSYLGWAGKWRMI
ncbi:hypothetical protein CDD81_1769 [Ophiocordyceps australis]|uniref:Uncharacterized protein n=1 Tax=Ophiocordyceps australis TaxID=1399860 RepID=A0A2C5YDJ4_9HYPO|nr:hypothetical protein CDD81_1769 [Ophiocordyceps australis]